MIPPTSAVHNPDRRTLAFHRDERLNLSISFGARKDIPDQEHEWKNPRVVAKRRRRNAENLVLMDQGIPAVIARNLSYRTSVNLWIFDCVVGETDLFWTSKLHDARQSFNRLQKVAFMSRIFRVIAVFGVGLGTFWGPATVRAGYVIETVTTGPTRKVTDFSMTLTVAKFDRSLGSLLDVIITDADSGKVQGTVFNTADSVESFGVIETTAYSLAQGSDLLLNKILFATWKYNGLAAFRSAAFGTFSQSGSAGPLVLTSGGIFDTFNNGEIDIPVTFAALSTTAVSGGGGRVTTAINATVGAILTVRYDYLPNTAGPPSVMVPEPSSVVMTALGGLTIAGAGFFRHRSRRPG